MKKPSSAGITITTRVAPVLLELLGLGEQVAVVAGLQRLVVGVGLVELVAQGGGRLLLLVQARVRVVQLDHQRLHLHGQVVPLLFAEEDGFFKRVSSIGFD